MTNLQERKELEDKIKQCDLNSLAMAMCESVPTHELYVVYFQRCDLLRQYCEKYGEEAYQQLRRQLDEARNDYVKNAHSRAKIKWF